MGWAYCGVNPTTGEEMGYGVAGTCHAEGCGESIDHGLDYVCGGMHEGGEHGCGRYFCPKHLESTTRRFQAVRLCRACLTGPRRRPVSQFAKNRR